MMTIAFAATGATAYVSSSASVNRGGEVTCTVGIKNGTDIKAIAIIPEDDESAFELVDGSWSITGLMPDFDIKKGDGVIAFEPGISINQSVLTFKLKAKDDATPGSYNVSAEVIITDNNGRSSLSVTGTSITVNCNHSYTKEDTTYLKSAATCQAAAVYYKSCVHCGAKGTSTFTYGEKADHSFTKQVITTAYRKSAATCTAKAVYYYCCATCTAKSGEDATFESGNTLNHSFTKKVITDDYKVSDASCGKKAVYNYCCATCDAKSTNTFEYGTAPQHAGGTATCTAKAICDACGQEYGNILSHSYTAEDATDAYLKTAATCTSKAVYYKKYA